MTAGVDVDSQVLESQHSQFIASQLEDQDIEKFPLNLTDAIFGSSSTQEKVTQRRANRCSIYDEITASVEKDSKSKLHDYYSYDTNKSCLLEQALHFVLTSPLTSVPSERVFSGAGFQVTNLQNRLSGSRTEDLMFLYENNIQVVDDSEDEVEDGAEE